jgi:hypothetical protein
LETAYSVFDSIAPPSQSVILEVQQLEACVNIFDEFADLKRAGEIA